MKKEGKGMNNRKIIIKKTNSGVTLIALVITIIVLLILAGVSIATLMGDNGLLTQAGNAKEKTNKATAEEKVQVEVIGSIGKNGEIDFNLLNKNLKENIKGLTYKGNVISETNKIENLPATVTVDGYKIVISVDGIAKVEATNIEYTDGTDTAMIPEGFTVSDKEGESTISKGLVVIGPDGSEFVWVPVDDINSMAQCGTAGGNCNLQLDENQHLKCTTHDSTEIVGKLYATAIGENFGTVNTTYKPNIGLREPAILSDYDNNTTEYNKVGLTLEGLKNEYKLMAESVAKNKGFYVGRYEISLESATSESSGQSGKAQSKSGVIPTSTYNSSTSMWYGLYNKAKSYTVKERSVQSSMIWGSQYDAMLNWIKNGTDKDKITLPNIGGNYSKSISTTGNTTYLNDSINHIRDLSGNLYELTLECYSNYSNEKQSRIYRGFGDGIRPLTQRGIYNPDLSLILYGSRLTLYIQ